MFVAEDLSSVNRLCVTYLSQAARVLYSSDRPWAPAQQPTIGFVLGVFVF